MYTYKALVTGVYDGDSITVSIDLGFGVWIRDQKVRLLGVDAPELSGHSWADGRKARDFLREKIFAKDVVIRTHKDSREKYGRWLAEVFSDDESVNDMMVAAGYVVPYDGGKRVT